MKNQYKATDVNNITYIIVADKMIIGESSTMTYIAFYVNGILKSILNLENIIAVIEQDEH